MIKICIKEASQKCSCFLQLSNKSVFHLCVRWADCILGTNQLFGWSMNSACKLLAFHCIFSPSSVWEGEVSEQSGGADLSVAVKPPCSGTFCPPACKCKEACSMHVQRTKLEPSTWAGADAENAQGLRLCAKGIFSCREILSKSFGRMPHNKAGLDSWGGSTNPKTSEQSTAIQGKYKFKTATRGRSCLLDPLREVGAWWEAGKEMEITYSEALD